MSSDDYQVQNISRYCRKSYKNNKREAHENEITQENLNVEDAGTSPTSDARSDGIIFDPPVCSCDLDAEGEIANILHKKRPVITLAQQQLQQLLDESDKMLCVNTGCCRSVYDFLCLCREILLNQNKSRCVMVVIIAVAFFFGLLTGAASCGSYLGRFQSPILTCIDNFFIPETYANIEDTYRSIV